MNNAPVITIDGPSGSGKGAVAAHIARRLGFNLLDSGALYRILGIAVLKKGVDIQDDAAVAATAESMNAQFDTSEAGRVLLDGEDVSRAIRSEKGSEMASLVGAIASARTALLSRQQAYRQRPGLVADGRDMGTVVFPDADLKIYLTASLEERAQRRYKQLIDKGISAILPDLLRDLKARDERDTQRAVSPLRAAQDAVVIDTTRLSLEEVVQEVMSLVADRLALGDPH